MYFPVRKYPCSIPVLPCRQYSEMQRRVPSVNAQNFGILNFKKAIFFQRYPKDSYKTRTEEKQKEKDLTRWDWINDMSQQYQNPQHEIEQEDEGNSGHQTIGQFLSSFLLRSRNDYSGP